MGSELGGGGHIQKTTRSLQPLVNPVTTRKDWFTGNLVRTDSSLFGCVGTGRARAGRAAASRQSDQNRHTEHTEQLSPPSSPVKSSVTSEHF